MEPLLFRYFNSSVFSVPFSIPRILEYMKSESSQTTSFIDYWIFGFCAGHSIADCLGYLDDISLPPHLYGREFLANVDCISPIKSFRSCLCSQSMCISMLRTYMRPFSARISIVFDFGPQNSPTSPSLDWQWSMIPTSASTGPDGLSSLVRGSPDCSTPAL